MGPIDAGRPGLARFNTSHGSQDKAATVRAGEKTLAEVANRLNVELNALIRANPQVRNPQALKAGQEITLPQQPEIPAANLPSTPPISEAGPSRAGAGETAPPLFADPLLNSLARLKLNQGAAAARLADGEKADSVRAVAASPSREPTGAQPATVAPTVSREPG